MTALLMLATVLVPLAMLAACLHPAARARVPLLLALAPLPGTAAALFADPASPLILDPERLRLTFAIDRPSALLLGCAALLWSAAGAYASAYLGRQPGAVGFAVWWLITLAGSLWVFLANDLVSFYLAFAMVSLAAFGLVVHDGTERARRAGAVYLFLTVLGEVCLLLGFALLAAAAPGDSLALADVLPALPEARARSLIVALLLAGFGLKAGLVPLHVWLPLAHPAAPMPASAVLSGAIIKAGIIGLIRFLPGDGGVADWGIAIAALGFVTAFWGVAVGVTQSNPKTVLAYSSISQMGVVAAALGIGLAAGAEPLGAAFYASHHVLAKGALFLGVGVAAASGQRWAWVVLAPALMLALGFGGLPFTGGALAKAAVKDTLGAGLVGVLASLSAIGSTLLMLHFVRRLATTLAADRAARAPAGLLLPWLVMATGAVVLPWALYPGDVSDVLDAKGLWAGLWPVLVGGALFAALGRWHSRLPAIPEGDVLLPAQRAVRRAAPLGGLVARCEAPLRAWPAAGLALLALAVLFGAAMFAAPN